MQESGVLNIKMLQNLLDSELFLMHAWFPLNCN